MRDVAMIEALYRCFTSMVVFPSSHEVEAFAALCGLGYAIEALQGHAPGYCITPAGYAAANGRWGHQQR